MGASYTTSYTDDGDRLHVVNCKNYGSAPINHHFLGSGQIVMHQEYRGQSHDVTLKLEGSTRGIVESGFLEKGAKARIRTLDVSTAKLCGAMTIRPEWPFNSEDEDQICIESVSPSTITGISGSACDSTSSLVENQSLNNIRLYPNPNSTGELTIDLGSELENREVSVSVFDFMGKEIRSNSSKQDHLIYLSMNPTPGVYTVFIQSESITSSIPFVMF